VRLTRRERGKGDPGKQISTLGVVSFVDHGASALGRNQVVDVRHEDPIRFGSADAEIAAEDPVPPDIDEASVDFEAHSAPPNTSGMHRRPVVDDDETKLLARCSVVALDAIELALEHARIFVVRKDES
jgi:hypothetical protein